MGWAAACARTFFLGWRVVLVAFRMVLSLSHFYDLVRKENQVKVMAPKAHIVYFSVLLVAWAAIAAGVQDSTPPLNITSWTNRTVMMIAAHPDDIEAMAGGLVANLTAQHTHVVYVIVTNGDKGCTDSALYDCDAFTSPDIAKIRQGEAIAAAARLNVTDVVLLDLEDAMVTRCVSM